MCSVQPQSYVPRIFGFRINSDSIYYRRFRYLYNTIFSSYSLYAIIDICIYIFRGENANTTKTGGSHSPKRRQQPEMIENNTNTATANTNNNVTKSNNNKVINDKEKTNSTTNIEIEPKVEDDDNNDAASESVPIV